jgi:uncharacterized protein (DUF427 family)
MKAIFNGKTIAESDKTVVVEGNHYFPPESVNREYLKPSDEQYTCPWKGEAKYYNVDVDGRVSAGGAWEYPEPKEAARQIKKHIAFWRGVEVVE